MEKRLYEVEYCSEEVPSVRLFPIKNIGVIGSRKLPVAYRGQIQHIVDCLIHSNYHVASGGAKGADAYVLEHLLRRERADCGVLFSAWDTFKGFPVELRKPIRYFQQQGGAVMWGYILAAQKALPNTSGDKRFKYALELALEALPDDKNSSQI